MERNQYDYSGIGGNDFIGIPFNDKDIPLNIQDPMNDSMGISLQDKMLINIPPQPFNTFIGGSAGDASLTSGAPYLSKGYNSTEYNHYSLPKSNSGPRVKGACAFCRKRKLKCDRGKPCHNCEKRAIDCTYSAPNRDKNNNNRNQSSSDVYSNIYYQPSNSERHFSGEVSYSPSNTLESKQVPTLKGVLDPNQNITPRNFFYSTTSDVSEAIACVDAFVSYIQKTKLFDIEIGLSTQMVTEYWTNLMDKPKFSDLVDGKKGDLQFHRVDTEYFLSMFEYSLVFLLGAFSLRLNVFIDILFSVSEKLMTLLFYKKKVHGDNIYSERLVTCLLLFSVYYETQTKTKLALTCMSMAHHIIQSNKSSIRSKITLEKVYLSLLSMSSKVDEQKQWIIILEEQQPFSHTMFVALEIAYVTSSLRIEDTGISPKELWKRLDNADEVLQVNRSHLYTFGYFKLHLLFLKSEILARQKNFRACAEVIDQIMMAAYNCNLPSPVIYFFQTDLANFRSFCSEVDLGMTLGSRNLIDTISRKLNELK